VALAVLLVIPRMVTESRMEREKGQGLDIAGAVTSTAGLVAIVYGLLQAAEHPWGSASVVLPLAGGIALLLAMVIIERRVENPLIPLDFFANRTRSVINLTSLFFMAAFISYTFILTLFEQHVLKYSPLETGLAYLPLGFGIGIGIGVGTALTPRIGVRAIVAMGFIGAGIGLLLTSTVDVDTHYAGGILPGMVVFGVFAGATMPAATSAALHQVTDQNSSLASGVQNTMQQIGGALGLAVLVPLAIRYTTSEIQAGVPVETAVTSGYVLAFRVGAALMIIGGVLIMALFERVDPALRDPTSEIVAQTR
jgi:MFS family permease